jgi:hypothetical protein
MDDADVAVGWFLEPLLVVRLRPCRCGQCRHAQRDACQDRRHSRFHVVPPGACSCCCRITTFECPGAASLSPGLVVFPRLGEDETRPDGAPSRALRPGATKAGHTVVGQSFRAWRDLVRVVRCWRASVELGASVSVQPWRRSAVRPAVSVVAAPPRWRHSPRLLGGCRG